MSSKFNQNCHMQRCNQLIWSSNALHKRYLFATTVKCLKTVLPMGIKRCSYVCLFYTTQYTKKNIWSDRYPLKMWILYSFLINMFVSVVYETWRVFIFIILVWSQLFRIAWNIYFVFCAYFFFFVFFCVLIYTKSTFSFIITFLLNNLNARKKGYASKSRSSR